MNPNIRRMLLSLLLLGASLPVVAQGTPARDQLEQLTRGLETIQARFRQTVVSTDGSIEDESEGRLWLRAPHDFRWEYGGDFPEVVVADGENIWIHDIALEQVTVKPQSEANSPLTVLTDIDRLDEEFEVREAGDFEGMYLLELRPVKSESEFDRVLLGLADGTLRLMAMEDAFGLRTEIHFADMQRNEPIEDGLFTFTPPPGADVIGGPEAEAAAE